MSCKEQLLIYVMVCVLLVVLVARHFVGDVRFFADHLVASAFHFAPSLLYAIAAHAR